MRPSPDPLAGQLAAAGDWHVLESPRPVDGADGPGLPWIRLRPPKLEDAPPLLELLRDPGVTEFFIWSPPRTAAQAREYVAGFQREMLAHLAYHFTVLTLPEETPVGIINLYHLERNVGSRGRSQAEIGIWVGRPAWGRGIGYAACWSVLHFAFDSLGFDEIVFRTQPRNDRARRSFERLGARPLGWTTLQNSRTGQPTQHLVYRIRRAEWGAGR